MTEQIIAAGFGGQGVLSLGKMLAEAAMVEGYEVTWLPSYGPEMRGGTSNCHVVISDKWIGSPAVTQATAVIVMNQPSLEKFEDAVAPGGMIFVNSSIIEKKVSRTDIKAYYVPANDIATKAGSDKVANMAMLGAYLSKCAVVNPETLVKQLAEVFGEKKAHLVDINRKAISMGGESIK